MKVGKGLRPGWWLDLVERRLVVVFVVEGGGSGGLRGRRRGLVELEVERKDLGRREET